MLSRLNIRLAPARVPAESPGLRELLALGELYPDRREHGPSVADVGARDRGLLAGPEGRCVGFVAGEYVFRAGHHRVTERASLKPGVSTRAFKTSSGESASTVTAIAAGTRLAAPDGHV